MNLYCSQNKLTFSLMKYHPSFLVAFAINKTYLCFCPPDPDPQNCYGYGKDAGLLRCLKLLNIFCCTRYLYRKDSGVW